MDEDYDAIVLGTGLKECIISGLLSSVEQLKVDALINGQWRCNRPSKLLTGRKQRSAHLIGCRIPAVLSKDIFNRLLEKRSTKSIYIPNVWVCIQLNNSCNSDPKNGKRLPQYIRETNSIWRIDHNEKTWKHMHGEFYEILAMLEPEMQYTLTSLHKLCKDCQSC